MSDRENRPANLEMRIVGPVNNETDIVQPRQPSNMQDLLRYSTEVGSSANSVQNPSNIQHMDPGRRAFLENALASMVEDPIQEVKDAMNFLKPLIEKHSEINEEELDSCTGAFTTISELVENIDIANDFYKLGGLEFMNKCLEVTFNVVRCHAANIIAHCCQNNPFCQKEVMVINGLLSNLMQMVEKDPSINCQIKALYALSCIVRDNEEGLSKFIELDGLSLLVRVLQSENETLKTKSAFMVSTLLSKNSNIKDNLTQVGFVEELVGLIQGEHSRAHEHLLSALLTLLTENETALKECQRPALDLCIRLHQLLEEYKTDEAFLEEIDYIKQILKIAFSGDSEGER